MPMVWWPHFLPDVKFFHVLHLLTSTGHSYPVGGLDHHFLFSHILGCDHHPNWRTHIFQRGGLTTNQLWRAAMNFGMKNTPDIDGPLGWTPAEASNQYSQGRRRPSTACASVGGGPIDKTHWFIEPSILIGIRIPPLFSLIWNHPLPNKFPIKLSIVIQY